MKLIDSLLFAAMILAALLQGCATANPARVYQIGNLSVRLYDNQEALESDLARLVAVPSFLKLHGYYDRNANTIYSMNDATILLHELKHRIEPGWNHKIGELEPR
jgi:uncharacterized lipoprotein YmbA